jgi:glutathione S-transferase
MAQLTVFSARACPFAHRTRLALGEKRLEFELVEIDLQNKPTWFNTVSVYGKVPALQHDGHRIVESAIVNEYLEEVFPEPALLPRAPAARAAARIWIDFANTRFVPAWGTVLRGATELEREAGRRDLEAALEHIDNAALGQLSGAGPFWFGPELSLVDIAFYPWFERWAALEHHRGVSVPAKHERLARWRAAVSERQSVKDIENPTSFYIERYAKFVQPALQAASA